MQIEGSKAIIQILGAPICFDNVPSILLGGASERVRKAFYANQKLLCGKNTVDEKLSNMLMLVRPAALWVCSVWPANEALLKVIHSDQFQLVRKALGK